MSKGPTYMVRTGRGLQETEVRATPMIAEPAGVDQTEDHSTAEAASDRSPSTKQAAATGSVGGQPTVQAASST